MSEHDRIADLLTGADVRVQVPNVGTMTGFLRRESAEYVATVLAEHDARIKAEALREAANGWTQGEWSNVMLPQPAPPAVPVIAYSNRVGDWLRDRADRIEATP